MDVGPSGGFMGGVWDKIRTQLPGMVNAVGSSMPGPWGQASQATGQMMKGKQKKNQQPGVNPSAGAPNSPFGNVRFGGQPSTMGGQPQSAGMPGMQGGMNPNISSLWNPYMQGGGMGLNRPVMF